MTDEEVYSIKNQSLFETNEELSSSLMEVPVDELSGDEAAEKSFASSFQSSMFLKGGKLGLFLAGITIMKSLLGIGILGMVIEKKLYYIQPNIFKNFGLFFSLLIILFVYINHLFTTSLLLKAKNLSKHSNFSTIAYFIFERRFVIIIINLFIILNNSGACIGELIIFGTTSDNLIGLFYEGPKPFYLQKWFITIIAMILLSPLCLVQKIEKLRYVSLTAIISLISFTMIVIYNFTKDYIDIGSFGEGFGFFPTDFKILRAIGAFPTVLFAYNWQFNCFPIYKAMTQAKDANLLKACLLGFSFASFLYLIVGILGYATYGNEVLTLLYQNTFKIDSDYLSVIKPERIGKPLYIFLNIAFVLSTTLTFPLIYFGARNNCVDIVKAIFGTGQNQVDNALSQQDKATYVIQVKKMRKKRQQIIFFTTSLTFILLLITIALSVKNLGVVFNFIGAVACNTLSIIIPCLYYFKLVDIVKKGRFENAGKKILYYFTKVYFVFGVALIFVCLISEFAQ